MTFEFWSSFLASPLEHTFVVTSTFSLPWRKRSMTAALCSTVISPLSNATWWPSLISCADSQAAILRVWEKNENKKKPTSAAGTVVASSAGFVQNWDWSQRLELIRLGTNVVLHLIINAHFRVLWTWKSTTPSLSLRAHLSLHQKTKSSFRLHVNMPSVREHAFTSSVTMDSRGRRSWPVRW